MPIEGLTVDRLEFLTQTYSTSLSIWKKYVKLCKQSNILPKDFLHDIELYKNNETLEQTHFYFGVTTIVDRIQQEIIDQFREILTEKQLAKPSKTVQLKKSNRKVCAKCGQSEIVHIFSKACDNNTIIYPNGKEQSGYLPEIPGLSCSDGLMIDLCVPCGCLIGYDGQQCQQLLNERNEDENEISSMLELISSDDEENE
ncbi:unnamed protein product [Didymodactylos carnosus]|uniref:Uncharacterized protein n=1 Tax=Didymodactylos carnosus TaxID=1234261 RepID=A0A813SKN4_9BILA|nr:unnamed protein product [Didymodactylos carnosus]CAF1374904.1 unnamed protein product [Didymodactylos carnosus]CAF3587064.1 unnamed protein product [Didymodactylos carnosus]CAF4183852.1 unnamed protein product [Didymodactylos carnosus]